MDKLAVVEPNPKATIPLCRMGIDGGKTLIDPITYTINLSLSNAESAKRFLDAIPSAEVIKGDELLAKKPEPPSMG